MMNSVQVGTVNPEEIAVETCADPFCHHIEWQIDSKLKASKWWVFLS